jgi:uncharacterized protein (DUF1330 family)
MTLAIVMSAVPTLHGRVQMPAYVITEIDVTDAEAFREYAPQVQPTFQPFGGRYVVRGGNVQSLAGAPPKRIVVIAFDNMDRARSWYDSPKYGALKSLRDKAGKARIFVVEGYLP